MFQLIYAKALDEPAIGYEASPKFRRAITNCPKCHSKAYIRLRGPRQSVIGITCSKCPWINTYRCKPTPEKAPKQTRFDTDPKVPPPAK